MGELFYNQNGTLVNVSRGVEGPQGDKGDTGDEGIIIGPTPPPNTDVLWADTAEDSPKIWFDPLFVYSKTDVPIDIPATWTEINRLTVDAPAGTYLWGISITWEFDVTNRSAYFRFSRDDGQTWGAEYAVEPSDASNIHPFFYQFPIEHPGGSRQVVMQARKENNQGVLTVLYSDLYYQRVL